MKRAPLRKGRRPSRRRTKGPEDIAPWAVGNPIRLAVLTLLHEKELSAGEIADLLGLSNKTATEYLRQLYDAGCIEFVGHEGHEGKNFKRAMYRAVARPYVSDSEYRAMSFSERQELHGLALQWILAGATTSHRSGQISRDEDACLISDEPNLDVEGRRELRELLIAVYGGGMDSSEVAKSVQEIEARAANRMAESGEAGTTVFVALLAFERAHTGNLFEGLTEKT